MARATGFAMTATLTPPPEQQKRKPPFLVRRSPVFYGWAIVGLVFSTSMVTAGISGYGLSFFVVPMSEALGVTRAEFSSITCSVSRRYRSCHSSECSWTNARARALSS